jgi:hypothetical protein
VDQSICCIKAPVTGEEGVSIDEKVFYQTFWCLLTQVSTQQPYRYGDGHGVGRRKYVAVIFSGDISKKKTIFVAK